MFACDLVVWAVGSAPCAGQPQAVPLPAQRFRHARQGAGRPAEPSPATGTDRQQSDADSERTRPSPLDTGANLKAPVPASTDLRFPINLATALRLSDARPLIVAAAQASVWVAEAELTRAKVLWVPTLNIGFDYIRHDGGGPDFNKGILTAVSTNFFYAGAGLTGTPFGIIYTTDAVYEPLLARQVLNSRHYDVQTAKNDALNRTADAYFLVHQNRGTYAGNLYCVKRAHELVERIATMSRDLVPQVEVDRARNMLAELQQRAVSARQQWRVQSANLTQVLRLDPRAVVEPVEHDHLQITLIDPARRLEELMPVAMANRPEIASRKALVEAAEVAIRREKGRMVLPNVVLNGFQTPYELLQGGIFGFGPNSSMNQWVGRDDFSIQPLWQLTSLGIGNLAMIKGQRASNRRRSSRFSGFRTWWLPMSTRGLADVQSAAARVAFADRALRTGIITLNGNFEGLKEISRFGDVLILINRPQEAVYALQLLQRAFEEYFTTVAEYNRAQFELYHALGILRVKLPMSVRPVKFSRWTRLGLTSFHPWAMGRRRRLDSCQPSRRFRPPAAKGAGRDMFDRPGRVLVLFTAVAAFQPALAQAHADRPSPSASPSASVPRAEVPPSTVSPAIERFMKQTGQDLPPPLPQASVARTAPVRPSAAAPAPALRPAPAASGRANQNVEDVLRDLPQQLQGARPRRSGFGPPAAVPLAIEMHLKSAPFDHDDLRFPINLATALNLSDARPLVVASCKPASGQPRPTSRGQRFSGFPGSTSRPIIFDTTAGDPTSTRAS